MGSIKINYTFKSIKLNETKFINCETHKRLAFHHPNQIVNYLAYHISLFIKTKSQKKNVQDQNRGQIVINIDNSQGNRIRFDQVMKV